MVSIPTPSCAHGIKHPCLLSIQYSLSVEMQFTYLKATAFRILEYAISYNMPIATRHVDQAGHLQHVKNQMPSYWDRT